MPLGRVFGWSPQQFWQATWHDLTSHLYMHHRMLRPPEQSGRGTTDASDPKAAAAFFDTLARRR